MTVDPTRGDELQDMPDQVAGSRLNTTRTLSIAERIALVYCETGWSTLELLEASRRLFVKPMSWLDDMSVLARATFSDRPLFDDLVSWIEGQPSYRLNATKRRLRKRLRVPANQVELKSLKWVDWRLPKIESAGELASHLGIRGETLYWLASRSRQVRRRPDHYVRTWIKKRHGQRLIESPKSTLKSVQRQLLQDFLDPIPVHPHSHGFRQGRSVVSFVQPHVGKRLCLRMDLKDFFPCLRGRRVHGFWRSCGYASEICDLLSALVTTQTPMSALKFGTTSKTNGPPKNASTAESRLYLPAHLPQGAPTSPALANLIAYRLDCRLSGLAAAVGANYTRYADDLLFSGGEQSPTKAGAKSGQLSTGDGPNSSQFGKPIKSFAALVAAICLEEGFEVNFHKTTVMPSSQRQIAAGIVMNKKVNVPRMEFDQLKAILNNCIRHGPASQNRDHHLNFREHLAGRIAWVWQRTEQRAEKLQRLFDRIDWEQTWDDSTVSRVHPDGPHED